VTSLSPAQLAGAPAPIVVLEDDRTVAALIGQVLTAANIANPLELFTSGQDAVDHLARAAEDSRVPVLIILGLSVPDLSGLEVLRRVRALPELSAVPVVMLSGSGEDEDIERAYALGIDAYLVKPAGIHGLPDVIAGLGFPTLLLPRFE
jgi:DNA-binding response OmpR family regulator